MTSLTAVLGCARHTTNPCGICVQRECSALTVSPLVALNYYIRLEMHRSTTGKGVFLKDGRVMVSTNLVSDTDELLVSETASFGSL